MRGKRKQFGKNLASFQMIQDKLATSYTALETARLLVYRVLSACQRLEVGEGGRGEIHKVGYFSYAPFSMPQQQFIYKSSSLTSPIFEYHVYYVNNS